jgi:hypothetical protein
MCIKPVITSSGGSVLNFLLGWNGSGKSLDDLGAGVLVEARALFEKAGALQRALKSNVVLKRPIINDVIIYEICFFFEKLTLM